MGSLGSGPGQIRPDIVLKEAYEAAEARIIPIDLDSDLATDIYLGVVEAIAIVLRRALELDVTHNDLRAYLAVLLNEVTRDLPDDEDVSDD